MGEEAGEEWEEEEWEEEDDTVAEGAAAEEVERHLSLKRASRLPRGHRVEPAGAVRQRRA